MPRNKMGNEPELYCNPKDFVLNKRNRQRLEMLERRHDHLMDRVERDPSLTYDSSEAHALHWAIRVLRELLTKPDQPAST